MQLEEYKSLFLNKKESNQDMSNLVGRILRGKKPEDFLTLTDEPETRKIVMLMAEDGLKSLLGKKGTEILLSIGYEKEYIQYKIKSGNSFKLIVFERKEDIKEATWDNVAQLVSEIYPEFKERINKNLNGLKTTPFAVFQDQFMKMAKKEFRFVDRDGPINSFFMTKERYQNSSGNLLDTRRFLYNCVHLSDLFSGDGYTYDEQGNRGLREFVIKNKPLNELGKYILIDLKVDYPKD